jgi:hypothetical protein
LFTQAYRTALEAQGIAFAPVAGSELTEAEENCKLSVGRAQDPQSPLGLMGFEAVHRHCDRIPDGNRYHDNVGSFMVQRFRFPHGASALIIDSSDTGLARATLPGIQYNPALHGDVSPEQQSAIRYLFKGQGAEPLVVLAHSPWAELKEDAQAFLLKLGAASYVSAHTHLRSSILLHRRGGGAQGLFEMNIGSIVDWPIQAVRATFMKPETAGGAPALHVQWSALGSLEGDQQPEWMRRCVTDRIHHRGEATYQAYVHRHDPLRALRATVEVAERVLLMEPPTSQPLPPYPGTKEKPSDRWKELAGLSARIDLLEQRMRSDVKAQEYALCQAYWAAEATRLERTIGERAFDKGPPTQFANELSSVVLQSLSQEK